MICLLWQKSQRSAVSSKLPPTNPVTLSSFSSRYLNFSDPEWLCETQNDCTAPGFNRKSPSWSRQSYPRSSFWSQRIEYLQGLLSWNQPFSQPPSCRAPGNRTVGGKYMPCISPMITFNSNFENGQNDHYQACHQWSPRVTKVQGGPQGWLRWVRTKSIIFKSLSNMIFKIRPFPHWNPH